MASAIMKALLHHSITPLLLAALAAVALGGGGCSNLTPEQQAQWNATGNDVAEQAANVALDEASWRLRNSRACATSSDNKSTVNDGP
jgi:hypothetical protein